MASAAAGRSGAQTFNSMYFKPMLRKANYHRKSGSAGDSVKSNGEEVNVNVNHSMKAAAAAAAGDTAWWVRDDRTGIYYPKGHEKLMEDVPQGAAKDFDSINWFN